MYLSIIKLDLFYEKDKNYEESIQKNAERGNYYAAAIDEAERNNKIDGENLPYEKTYRFSKYLNFDPEYNNDSGGYAGDLVGMMASGSRDAEGMQGKLNQRTSKAYTMSDYNKYINDDFSKQVQSYIDNIRNNDPMYLYNTSQKYAGDKPQYNSQWDNTKNNLYNIALNMNYSDWKNGDEYSTLKEDYTRAGRQAMDDTIGQVAKRTGGLASTYATQVANQQYNNYMNQLETAARQMYENDRGNAVQNAQLAGGLADSDYNKYLGELSQYNNDRNTIYQSVSDYMTNNYNNKLFENTLNQQDYAKQLQEKEDNLARQDDARTRIDNFLKTGGNPNNLDPQLKALSGLTNNEINSMYNYYKFLLSQQGFYPSSTTTPVNAQGSGSKKKVTNSGTKSNSSNGSIDSTTTQREEKKKDDDFWYTWLNSSTFN